MTIDISKIRPGDKVTLVPLEVVDSNRKDGHILLRDGVAALIFRTDQIAAHHPAPREFQVGDRVRWRDDIGTIEHVARGAARILWDDGLDNLTPLNHLTLVEAGQ